MHSNNSSETSFPLNINDLINYTYQEYENKNHTISHANCLLAVLKKWHLWPSMQIKKFKGRSDIVLLHNTYKRNDVNEYKDLYEQCRSVVLDFALTEGNVVVTFANSIPDRINYDTYINTIYDPCDKCYEAYDGTMITVYNYKGEWYFGTSSCPDANSSKFSHPTKKHGNMLDEILFEYFRNNYTDLQIATEKPDVISREIRKMFTDNLDPSMAYEFLIIHHQNNHIIDYTSVYGPNYKVLFHINTKQRDSLVEKDIYSVMIPNLLQLGVKYPMQFQNIDDASKYINENSCCYGVIIKKNINGTNKTLQNFNR